LKISNEAKIGLLAAITLAVLIFGYKFLKGKNLLDKSYTYYVIYPHVDMLDASAPVLTRGIKVGSVTKVVLNPKNIHEVLVTLDIKDEIQLPPDTKAILMSTGLLGGKAIDLQFDHFCNGDCLPNKSFITGIKSSVLATMLPKEELKEYLKITGDQLGGLLDTSNSKGQIGHIVNDMRKTMAEMAKISLSLNQILAENAKNIHGTMQNIDQITTTLAKNSNALGQTISNFEQISNKINQSNPGQLVQNLDQTILESKKSIKDLSSTLEESKKTINGLNQTISQINNGQGTLGKLIQDKSLYNNLEKTSKNLDLLLQDLRLNPQRYIHVSVFRGKGENYVKPTDDPAFDQNK